MLKITCEFDDGFSLIANLSSIRTVRELLVDLCKLRNVYDNYDNLSVVLTFPNGEIQSLLCQDVSVRESIGDLRSIRIIGWLRTFGKFPIPASQTLDDEYQRKRPRLGQVEAVNLNPDEMFEERNKSSSNMIEKSTEIIETNRLQIQNPEDRIKSFINELHEMIPTYETPQLSLSPRPLPHQLYENHHNLLLFPTTQNSSNNNDNNNNNTTVQNRIRLEKQVNSNYSLYNDDDDGTSDEYPRNVRHRNNKKEDSSSNNNISMKNVFIPDMAELERFQSLRTTSLSKRSPDREWDDRFELLLAYERAFGHCNAAHRLICRLPNGIDIRLGRWVDRQRQDKRLDKLRPDRLERLQKLVDEGKFAWARTDEEAWNLQYDALVKYGEDHGGECNVPKQYTTKLDDGSEVQLGKWLSNQRSNRKIGKLRADREAKLQQLVDQGCLAWSLDPAMVISDDESWADKLNLLIKYGADHGGNCNVPKSYVHDNGEELPIQLGEWLHNQRQCYRRGRLKPEREASLQQLVNEGKLAWSTERYLSTDDEAWNLQYDALVKYGEDHGGDCNVPTIYRIKCVDGNDLKLGIWLSAQKSKYRSGKLRVDRLERLQELVDVGNLRWSFHQPS